MKTLLSKRILTTIGFMVLIMVIIVGCSSNEETQQSSEETNMDNSEEQASEESNGDFSGQTLTVMLIGFDKETATDPKTGEEIKGVDVLKEEFEKQHQGAEVEFVLLPWEGYTEKTQAMLTSGEADVYQMPGVNDFSSQGFLEPLQPYIDEDNFDLSIFFDNQVEGWKSLGPEGEELEVYGMPFQGDVRVIAYDKQLFDEWDVEYLSDYPTVEEISKKAEKMTGTNPVTGEKNYGIWFRGDWNSAFKVVNYAEGQNSSWGEGFAWDEVEFNFNSPEMLEGLNWLLDMRAFAPNGLTSNQGNEKWVTEENDIAIMLNQAPGGLIKDVYAQGLEDRIGIVQEFKNDEGVGGMFAGSPLTIAKDSENKDLAWEWIKFTTSEFAQEYVYNAKGSVPVIKSAAEWESVKEKPLLEPVLEGMSTMWTPKYPWGSSQPRYILTSEIEAALTGERTAEEALDKAQKESTEWVENR